jgi:sulfate adenylyltransferase subunit 2
MWIVVDDERLPLEPGETPVMKQVRFRTIGCYPLTAAVESDARTVDDIVVATRPARWNGKSAKGTSLVKS